MKQTVTIDWDLLSNLSYRTNLNKSLKNTLRKFDKTELFEELNEMIMYFTEEADRITHEKRVKALQSCLVKYERYFPNKQVEKVFNDILGIRIVIDDYTLLDKITFPPQTKIADMQHGKANDDGYRGVHVYYQKDHFHYPIEIQFVTAKDRQFNEWLHIYLYKYVNDTSIGQHLRRLYENGIIQTEEDFRKEMKEYVLPDSKKI